MKTIIKIWAIIALLTTAACASKKPVKVLAQAEAAVEPTAQPADSRSKMMPKAVIYRTSGEYADHVFVNENPSGVIVSYPDPKDIIPYSTPIELGDGWLLDRRGGICEQSRFLTYTYDEYSQLPRVPSREALKQSIIPGAVVTQCIVTPVTVQEAIANPEIVKKYIP